MEDGTIELMEIGLALIDLIEMGLVREIRVGSQIRYELTDEGFGCVEGMAA